ncbi:MAG: hypothetical protein EB023_09825 [Flavobacteriia bacterium]|nr:hypothetical protein [Flavobacteriia bacterium]
MPAKRKNHLHPCRFFEWKIFERNGHFYADGRAGSNPGNRHSLKATSYEEALQALQRLDLVMAAEHGLVKYEQVADQLRKPLSIEEGISRYLKERERDLFNGGIRHKTLNRYRPILRKFAEYCLENGTKDWNQVDTDLVKDYQAHLFSQGFMQPTVGMETTLIKQTVKFFVRKNLLPTHSKIDIKVPKTKATGRHAFSIEEADAILEKARNSYRMRNVQLYQMLLQRKNLTTYRRTNHVPIADHSNWTFPSVDECASPFHAPWYPITGFDF